MLVALSCLLNMHISYGQTIDGTFTDPLPLRPAKINCIKVFNDNKILLGGDITFYKSERVNNLIRLNSDNTLDKAFNFEGNKSVKIRKMGFLSTGDIIILGNFEREPDVISEKWSLYHLSPDGILKKEIDTLLNCGSIAIQTDDKILVTADASTSSGISHHLYRFNSDFTPDVSFNNTVLANGLVSDVKTLNNKIYICGLFSTINGTTRNGIAVLNNNGSIDTSFDPKQGTTDALYSLTVQPDGKILLGKTFINMFNGVKFYGMIRLKPDGSIDYGFNPPHLNSPTSEIIIKDTSIFVAAHTLSSESLLLKLNSTGLADPNFTPVKLDAFAFNNFCAGFSDNGIIFNSSITTGSKFGLSACDFQGRKITTFTPEVSRFGVISAGDYFNGKLLISGDFMKVNNVSTYGIALLDKNGVADDHFVLTTNPGKVQQIQIINDTTFFISTFSSFLKLDANAKILRNFDFQIPYKLYEILKFKVLKDGNIMAADANGIARLKSDGTEDISFNTGTGISNSCTGIDFDMQGDKIIYGSDFNSFNGTNVPKLVRLNSNGSLDLSFNPGSGADGTVLRTKVLASGEIIVGGWFTHFNGKDTPHGIVKLSKDGHLDSTFLSNQNKASFFSPIVPFETKVEQIDSTIYFKNKSSVISFNLDGTFNNQFVVPATITTVNDIVSGKDTVQGTGKRKSLSGSKTNSNLFIMGSFKKSNNSDPTFIMKLNLDTKTTLPILSVSASSLNIIAAENSTSTFNISSNISWDVTSNQQWLSVSLGWGSNNSTITVTASANTMNSPRTAIVTISGFGVPSRTITVVQDAELMSVAEISNANIKLWPVPVKDILHLSFSETDQPLYLELLFSNGLNLYSSQLNSGKSEIDMTKFDPGIYYIKIITYDKKVIIRKIIKQ